MSTKKLQIIDGILKYEPATTTADGLMSSEDKLKLDGVATGANKTIVDSALSSTSANPVQNKVVNTAISNLSTLVGDTPVATQIDTAITSQKGATGGIAELDSNGKVPAAQLPSYVDDVLEYTARSNFPSTGETGKIYVDTETNLTYRWSGSDYVEISPSLALGTTSSTAFRGDYGNTAYTHATAKGSAFASGLYKITTNAQGHVTAATVVEKSDITGLGIPAQDTTYSAATTSAAGLMSVSDKTKLDAITDSADSVSFSPSATSGNKVGTITINGTATNMYSPTQTSVSGNAGSATVLANTRYIDGVSFTGAANVTRYATCSTAAATAAKTASITTGTFSLITGARVTVKFTDSNSAASPTLNIGSTGAKEIYWHGAALTSSQYWQAGAVLDFVYNGTQWDLIGVAKDNNTTYSAATTSAAGLMSKDDKSKLDNLDTLVGDTAVSTQISNYAAPKSHTHDDRYYTESEINSKLSGKSDTNHTHSTLNSPDGSELLYCYSNDGDTKTLFQTKSNSGDYSYCKFGNNTFYTGEGYRVYDENYKPALTDLSGTLAVANGGTGATTAAAACANIGAVKKSGDTMTGGLTTTGLTIKSSNLYPGISLRASEQDEPSASIASNASTRRIYFTNYCSDSDYKELFFTPTPTTGRTSDASYHLLTSKNAVTIEQGGTGATTAIGACANIIKNRQIEPVCIEFSISSTSGHGGYIDFHFNGSAADYTSRIIEGASGTLSVNGVQISKGTISSMTSPLSVANGGTGANTASGARHNIGADHAYNLLVNSYFKNPVNSGGQTSYTANGDTVDRWSVYKWSSDNSATVNLSVNTDGVVLSGGVDDAATPSACYLYQKIDCTGLVGKTLTAAVYINSLSGAGTGLIGAYNGSTYIKGATLKAGVNVVSFTVPTGATQLVIRVGNDSSHAGKGSITASIKWVALYEGSYTADTLPDFVPYPKQVEMIRCGVSLTPHNLLDNSDFTNPVNQRGITGTVSSGYAFDRWYTYAVSGESIWWAYDTATKDMVVQNGGGNASVHNIVQTLPNSLNGKQLTYAVWDEDGSVTVLSGTVGTDTISGSNVSQFGSAKAANGNYYITLFKLASSQLCQARINVYTGKTARIKYAALYEGIYTADTLPPYVPKGYAAELAECQRYYYRMTSPGIGVFGIGTISGVSTTDNMMNCYVQINYAKNMRTWPGVWLSDFTKFKIGDFVTSVTLTSDVSMVAYSHATGSVFLKFSDAPRGSFNSAGKIVYLYDTDSSNAYIEFSADL